MNYREARGWLTPAEREALYSYARRVPVNGKIVNIGVEYGASVVCLYEGRQSSETEVFALDIDLSKYAGRTPHNVAIVEGNSRNFDWEDYCWHHLTDNLIDLLFIDGDHSYKGVRADLRWVDFVTQGGVVIFHDCYDWPRPGVKPKTPRPVCPEVNRAVEEWKEESDQWEELRHVDSMRIFKRR